MSQVTSTRKLIRVGHSPDPDDAFMFYALAKEKIPMRGFRVEHVIEDIEALNQRALAGELEVTAVSCHAYAYLADKYLVMRSGASVGDGYGPIVVQRHPEGAEGLRRMTDHIKGKRIGIPGKLTTAYLVLQLYERDFEPVFLPFDQVLDAVSKGTVDLGLIIHEGQLTFAERGLRKVLDLGRWWKEETGLPLPLGIDVIRRDLGEETIRSFAKLFRESIEFALGHRKGALEYAIQYGRGIGGEVNDRFVGMYVNDFTLDLGPKGEAGLRKLFEEGSREGILPGKVDVEFAWEK